LNKGKEYTMAAKEYTNHKSTAPQAHHGLRAEAQDHQHDQLRAAAAQRASTSAQVLNPADVLHLQRAIGNHMTSMVLQRHKGSKAKNKAAHAEPTIKTPRHSQEEIQGCIIDLWLDLAKDDLDLNRARYMRDYSGTEGGWCDGWSYALAQGGDALAEIWWELDEVCPDASSLSPTTKFEAVRLARSAALYHVMNTDAPTREAQLNAYKAAGFNREQDPRQRESWKHEFGKPLELYVIEEEIHKLSINQTLRLTSDVHDAAVKRISKHGYLVSETENHGIQECTGVRAVMGIIKSWQEACEKKDFFSQTLIIG
jgi:hypothetical protein